MIRKNELLDYLMGLESDDLIETLYLFGSWANEPATSGRDLDLAVIFNPGLNLERILWDCRDLQTRISEDLQIPVDLIDLEIAPTYLAQVILQTGLLIFCKDEDHRMETALSVFRTCRGSDPVKDHPWEVLGIDE